MPHSLCALDKRHSARLHFLAIAACHHCIAKQMRQFETLENFQRGKTRLVRINTKRPTASTQFVKRILNARIKHNLRTTTFSVMFAKKRPKFIKLHRLKRVLAAAFRNAISKQIPRSLSHIRNHRRLGNRFQTQHTPCSVDGIRQIRLRINQRSVHIKEYRFHSSTSIHSPECGCLNLSLLECSHILAAFLAPYFTSPIIGCPASLK